MTVTVTVIVGLFFREKGAFSGLVSLLLMHGGSVRRGRSWFDDGVCGFFFF